jgi:hypothetical protein
MTPVLRQSETIPRLVLLYSRFVKQNERNTARSCLSDHMKATCLKLLEGFQYNLLRYVPGFEVFTAANMET